MFLHVCWILSLYLSSSFSASRGYLIYQYIIRFFLPTPIYTLLSLPWWWYFEALFLRFCLTTVCPSNACFSIYIRVYVCLLMHYIRVYAQFSLFSRLHYTPHLPLKRGWLFANGDNFSFKTKLRNNLSNYFYSWKGDK